MKKQLKVSLRVTVFFMILAIAGILQSIPGADWGTKAQAASYSGDYRYWSQGASDDYNMRDRKSTRLNSSHPSSSRMPSSA